jgi:hypothetical protein
MVSMTDAIGRSYQFGFKGMSKGGEECKRRRSSVSDLNGHSPFATSPDNLSAAGIYSRGVVQDGVCAIGPGFAGGVNVIFGYL